MAMTPAERQAKRREKLLTLEQRRHDIELELVQLYNWSRWMALNFDANDQFRFDGFHQRAAVRCLEHMQDAVVRIAKLSDYEWCNPPVNRPGCGHDQPYTLPPIHETVSHEFQSIINASDECAPVAAHGEARASAVRARATPQTSL